MTTEPAPIRTRVQEPLARATVTVDARGVVVGYATPGASQRPSQRSRLEALFRYRVVSVWGHVPAGVAELLGKPDAFLLYPEYRGKWSEQGFTDRGDLVGGWSMEYVGMKP